MRITYALKVALTTAVIIHLITYPGYVLMWGMSWQLVAATIANIIVLGAVSGTAAAWWDFYR